MTNAHTVLPDIKEKGIDLEIETLVVDLFIELTTTINTEGKDHVYVVGEHHI